MNTSYDSERMSSEINPITSDVFDDRRPILKFFWRHQRFTHLPRVKDENRVAFAEQVVGFVLERMAESDLGKILILEPIL